MNVSLRRRLNIFKKILFSSTIGLCGTCSSEAKTSDLPAMPVNGATPEFREGIKFLATTTLPAVNASDTSGLRLFEKPSHVSPTRLVFQSTHLGMTPKLHTPHAPRARYRKSLQTLPLHIPVPCLSAGIWTFRSTLSMPTPTFP